MSWDFPFLFWGDVNGKFTYVPKYKPEISKLDYTNRHLSNSITFPVNLSPVQVDRIDHPFSRTFAQRLDLTMICLPKHCTKVNQTFNFTYININQRLVKLDYTNRHLSNSITFLVNLSPVQVDRIDRPFSRTFAQRLDLTMICLPKYCTKVNQTFNFTYLLELEAIRRFSSNIKYLIE